MYTSSVIIGSLVSILVLILSKTDINFELLVLEALISVISKTPNFHASSPILNHSL